MRSLFDKIVEELEHLEANYRIQGNHWQANKLKRFRETFFKSDEIKNFIATDKGVIVFQRVKRAVENGSKEL
jgi:hypothetical protein